MIGRQAGGQGEVAVIANDGVRISIDSTAWVVSFLFVFLGLSFTSLGM